MKAKCTNCNRKLGENNVTFDKKMFCNYSCVREWRGDLE